MSTEDDEPVGGARGDREDAGDALSPPERHSKPSRNRTMLAVVGITVVAVVVFVIVANLR